MKFLPYLVSLIGSYVGWWLGARIGGGGFMTSFTLSIVGAGVGMYLGRKWVLDSL